MCRTLSDTVISQKLMEPVANVSVIGGNRSNTAALIIRVGILVACIVQRDGTLQFSQRLAPKLCQGLNAHSNEGVKECVSEGVSG